MEGLLVLNVWGEHDLIYTPTNHGVPYDSALKDQKFHGASKVPCGGSAYFGWMGILRITKKMRVLMDFI